LKTGMTTLRRCAPARQGVRAVEEFMEPNMVTEPRPTLP
jgi:hypothetical protein